MRTVARARLSGPLAPLVRERSVLICGGPGGVGKTTMAAAIAVEAARLGRRACVVTIDPAKRLADALGVKELTNEPHEVEGRWGPGALWALMLDTKTTFDDVVLKHAASPEQAEVILNNRLYRNISGALSGTQEYMAMEKLYELHEDERFELVVVDTPPTRQALDFLDAPARLTRFLNNRIFRLLMMPTRASLRAVNIATQMFLRTISKVVGGEVVADAVAFFNAFEGMEQGFRERAERVTALLGDPSTAFLVVASPRRDAVEEAVFFARRLEHSGLHLEALIVNKMFPRFGRVGDDVVSALRHAAVVEQAEPLRSMIANLADLSEIASKEELYVEELKAAAPSAPVVRVPFLPSDVHDLAGLDEVASHLFGRDQGRGVSRPRERA